MRIGGKRDQWFSRQSMNIPDNIKEAAFAMKDGEVSDPITVEGTYHA